MTKPKREELDAIDGAAIGADGLQELVKELRLGGEDAGDVGGQEEGYLMVVTEGFFEFGHEGIYYITDPEF